MVKSKDRNLENSPLLGQELSITKKRCQPLQTLKHCCKKRQFCVKSKAAVLVLIWNFCIALLLTSWLDPIYYTTIVNHHFKYLLGLMVPIFCCFSATVYLFYPLAGYLADVKYGRYRVITCSLCSIPFIIPSLGAFLAIFWLWWVPKEGFLLSKAVFWAMVPIGLLVSVAVLTCHTAFSANVIQFGMDQLYESPTEDSLLFIYWFVFTSYLGFALFKVTWYKTAAGLTGISVLLVFGMVTLVCSLCLARCKRQWFLIHAASKNPYKMVYKVIRFAMDHKSPIRRSAFTYCEDELPSRMDLGKSKYGGPFSTEEVEDVKAFLGIVCLLLTLGPVFASDIARTSFMYEFSIHLESESFDNNSTNNHTGKGNYLISEFDLGILTEVFTAIFIVIYVYLIRPFCLNSNPKILKGMGLGMLLLLLSLVSLLLIDVVDNVMVQPHHRCFLSSYINASNTIQSLSLGHHVSRLYLILPHTFNALGYMSFYPAAYAFICAQSPHAMKGLLIGTFFAIKGIFQLLGALLSLSFLKWNQNFIMSCGSVYFLINIILSLAGLLAYICAAQKYHYRQRDEPDNTYRYAEEYYDKSDSEDEE